MGSNVKSNIWLCAQAIPQMAERGNGSVVIISSIGGLRGSTVIGAYGISKAADFSLCRSLAGEWGPKGVRVNCVAPGLVKTDFAKALWEDEERLKRRCATAPRCAASATRRNRRRGGLSGFRCLDLHDRPDHRRRRRRDDGVDIINSLRSRPCERRDPYRVVLSVEPWSQTPSATTISAGGYRSLRSQGRRPSDIDERIPNPLAFSNQQPSREESAHVLRPGHRSGHHILARHRVSRRHFDRRHRAAGIPAAFSGLRLGRARARGHLDLDVMPSAAPRWTRPASRRKTSPPSASPTSARPPWCGTARPGRRCTAPSSGRTAAPPISAPG